MSDSPPSSKEAVRAGVAERWISSQAGTNGNSPCAPPSSSSSSSSCASLPAATVWASFSAASQPPSSSSQGFPSPPTYSFGLQGIAKPIMNLNLAASAMATTDGTLLPETSNVGARSRNSNAFVSPPTSLLRSQPRESELIQGSSRNFYLSPLNDDNPANPSSTTFPSLGMPSSSSSSLSSASDLSYQATDQNPTNGFVAFPSADLPKLRIQQWEASPTRAVFPSSGNEKLYEAYNELHSLAQDFHKPFDSPAILVVGHQSDGKSALVEALMGFQFNHVGGGTKTRRPITLHMQYSATCLEPRCSLITDERPPREEERTLEELQAYIEAENLRLEREGCQFWAKEIVVKIEYKFCPNLTIIDMPGLIAAASGRKNQLLQAQARAVEALVRTKMQHKEFIILCLEDCSDWSNATTRRIVMQMDPELSRTVVVSTKLDTRIPQFARTADVEMFLHPPSRLLDGDILGETPFFTSIPSGRVGISRDSVYKSNDDFREAVVLRESQDIAALEEKLGRPLSKDERSRVGISRLRLFLEQLLQKRYMENVPLIVPMLDREYRLTTKKLRQTSEELGNLDEAKLKEKGRLFRDSFLAKLSLLLKGTVVAPPDKFGEALQDERVNGGAFVGPDGLQTPFKHMPNAGMRLYGGAQYHRAMAEFRFIVGSVKCPSISREEIVNACGVEDIHDGTNYFRSACVIAVSKARDVFEPFLHQLGFRLSHILRRLLPIGLYLLQKDGEYLSGHNMFMNHVSTAFNTFVESTERSCREKCMEDLMSTTRYVTWSLHNKNRSGLRLFLDSYSVGETSTINPVSGATIPSEAANMCAVGNGNKQDNKARQDAKTNFAAPNSESSGGNQTTQARLVDLLESTLWNRRLAPSSEEIVNALVAQIFEGIRDHFVSSAELKFNCFFLMPVVDKFPARLREDLEVAFEEDLDNVFNVAQARRALDKQKADLEFELRRIERLQENFSNIHRHLSEIEPSAKDFAEEISLLKITER